MPLPAHVAAITLQVTMNTQRALGQGPGEWYWKVKEEVSLKDRALVWLIFVRFNVEVQILMRQCNHLEFPQKE